MTPPAKSLAGAVLLLAVALAPSFARADGEDDDFARSGAYVGVGASATVNLIENYLDDELFLDELDVDDSFGVNARVGYRVASWFALEGEYEWLGPMNVEVEGFGLGELQVQAATANLRFIVPTWRFQPYLLVGGGALFIDVEDTFFNSLEVDETSFAARIGVGIDVYLTRSLLLNAGVEAILSNAEVALNTGFGRFEERGVGTVNFQLGLGYRF